ncbi:hypothetical protein PSQ19_13470 [Devosia algicola]|uniref:Uncharacterized protein n=1 Tax=Devosia algicola TaxID=3026418 RepID=A0ABY7YKM8_9HYPH|nr:hypothetical protein [Devosia algicola]WDR01742.1 hypothetical protein PSQ19_13470 [Devosia algicola]
MNMNLMTNQILTDWQPHHASLFGNHSLALAHNLAASSLFTDEALARLIENSPREAYHVNYSQKTPGNPPKRREGEIKNLSGLEVLDTVRNGNIWVNLTAPGTVDSAYTDLLNAIYAEFEERVPGFKSLQAQPDHPDFLAQCVGQISFRRARPEPLAGARHQKALCLPRLKALHLPTRPGKIDPGAVARNRHALRALV